MWRNWRTRVRAVHRRGAVDLLGDALQPGDQHERDERQHAPDVHDRDERQRGAVGGQPDVRVIDDVQLQQHAVEQPAVGVEHPPPQHAADHRRQRPREDQDREHDPAAAEHLVERDRDDQPEHELERHRERHVEQRVADRIDRGRGLQHLAVVVEPDELRRRAVARVAGLEARLEALRQRIDDQHRGEHHGGRHHQDPEAARLPRRLVAAHARNRSQPAPSPCRRAASARHRRSCRPSRPSSAGPAPRRRTSSTTSARPAGTAAGRA